jgi:dephospho-CoA kinase
MTQANSQDLESLVHLINTIHRLRAPGGCPWDRAQTHQSLRQYLIEEAYEVLDVIDQIHSQDDLKRERIRESFREELGDLLMQVLLHAEMTNEVGAFNIYDVARGLDAKLIRRHPHVFGEEAQRADSADHALQRWEKEKAKEKASKLDASILDGVPKGLPALQKAARVIEKVTKVGFQWDDMHGPLGKLDEELQEFKSEILQLEKDQTQETLRKKAEAELGDLIFSLCNVGYLMKLNPEAALRSTLSRFESRFQHVERRLKESQKTFEQSDLKEMDQFWDEAKQLEKTKVWGLTGGIGSGKSTAAGFFSELGIPVIDADQIARRLSEKEGPAHDKILERFGTSDRAKLREIVFNDPQAKKDLEEILHPLIRAASRKEIEKLSQNHSLVIYEASLLIETGRQKDFAGLIVVDAPKDLRIQRIISRSPITPEVAQKMIDQQTTDDIRKMHADFVLSNSGTLEDLKKNVSQLLARLKKS